MQALEIDEYTNSSGWKVVHDGDTNMFFVKSDKGHKLEGMFTQRTFAESHLRRYLRDINDSSKPKSKKMKAQARTPSKE